MNSGPATNGPVPVTLRPRGVASGPELAVSRPVMNQLHSCKLFAVSPGPAIISSIRPWVAPKQFEFLSTSSDARSGMYEPAGAPDRKFALACVTLESIHSARYE